MTPPTHPLPILVIGAGIGGLCAAIRLAAQGHAVQMFEQQSYVGGKMNEVRADGFRWDTGPSVITMPHVLEAVFSAAGRRIEDYLTLMPIEPLTRYFYPDGTVLDATRDLSRMAAQIAALDERDVEGYLAYLAYAARLHRITGKVFIYDDPPTWASLTKVPLRDALRVDGLRSMQAAISSFVRSPHLRQLLGRFATYVGASPYRAPATLNVIAHVELTGGVWYPQGGIYAIARALERLATELGVQLQTGCRVAQIIVREGTACGLTLADGNVVEGSAVVANVDVATVIERLLPSGAIPVQRVQRVVTQDNSCSGFIMLLGVAGHHPQLAHHNIFFSQDYRQEFADIFERGVPPADPTIYVAITAKHDAQDAPPGCENWFVLVNAPPLSPRFDWGANAAHYRDLVLARLAGLGMDVRQHIRSERWLTPLDLERLTGARRGALYGLSSNNPFTAFQRPHNRDPHVQRLYYVGGTTHPGGGVPMVALSGAATARMVIADMER
jgi:phytoene desaturase